MSVRQLRPRALVLALAVLGNALVQSVLVTLAPVSVMTFVSAALLSWTVAAAFLALSTRTLLQVALTWQVVSASLAAVALLAFATALPPAVAGLVLLAVVTAFLAFVGRSPVRPSPRWMIIWLCSLVSAAASLTVAFFAGLFLAEPLAAVIAWTTLSASSLAVLAIYRRALPGTTGT